MIEVLFSWIYMLIMTGAVGGVLFLGLKNIGISVDQLTISSVLMMGIVGITVYAEWFSIFYKVSAGCHILLIAILIVCLFFKNLRHEVILRVGETWDQIRKLLFSKRIWFFLIVILGIAFFTSRGKFHTDTGIYHAQAIRMIEEIGVAPGLANFQLHFGYNSSYLLYCAFFTLSWLKGTEAALHTTTGFIGVVVLLHALNGFADLFMKRRSVCMSDGIRMAIYLYLLVIASGLMSPATDYGTLLIVCYVLLAWLEEMEGENNRCRYGLLSMLALFAVTMKLSAAGIFILVLYPLICFCQKKEWKKIVLFIGMGIIIGLPFVIRNIILTGWLFYPVEAIDLFSFDYKVPVEYLHVDAAQIKVWGRCLFDITLENVPIKEWVPIWWEAQEHYDQMMLYAVVLSFPLLLLDLIMVIKRRSRIYFWNVLLYIVAIMSCLLIWFLEAPFVRYGLCFILALPWIAVALFLQIIQKEKQSGVILAGGIFLSTLCIVGFMAEIDHYVMDNLLFVKHYVTEDYYITQKRFETPQEEYKEINGIKFYYAGLDEVSSYVLYPSTCYTDMLDRSELRGDSIKDGFRAKK